MSRYSVPRHLNKAPFADCYEPAMSFEEIGAELGISMQRAKQLYDSALRKLRAKPDTMRKLREMAREMHPYG